MIIKVFAASADPLEDLVQKTHGYILFVHDTQLCLGIRRYKGDYICVAGKTGPLFFQVVCHDHVQMFVYQFLPGIFDHMLRLHGEATEKLARDLVLSEVFQYIVGALQGKGHLTIRFLYFFIAYVGGPVVGHSRSLYDDVLILTAWNISMAEMTGMVFTNNGGSSAVCPETSVTSAPRSMHILAIL